MTATGHGPANATGRDGAIAGRLHVFYGGTFDPVHHGHLLVARSARDALGCAIRMMPAADPPHRPPPGASAGQRARMLALAIDGEPGLVLDERLPPALAAHLAGRWTDDPGALGAAPAGRVLRLHQPVHPGSATEIRRRIASGEHWRDLVPATVADYIDRHGLYRVHGSQTAGSL